MDERKLQASPPKSPSSTGRRSVATEDRSTPETEEYPGSHSPEHLQNLDDLASSRGYRRSSEFSSTSMSDELENSVTNETGKTRKKTKRRQKVDIGEVVRAKSREGSAGARIETPPRRPLSSASSQGRTPGLRNALLSACVDNREISEQTDEGDQVESTQVPDDNNMNIPIAANTTDIDVVIQPTFDIGSDSTTSESEDEFKKDTVLEKGSNENEIRSSSPESTTSSMSGKVTLTSKKKKLLKGDTMPKIIGFKRESDGEKGAKEEIVRIGEKEVGLLQRGETEPVEVISLCTQTEWSWLEDMKMRENLQHEVLSKEHTRRLSQGTVSSQGSKGQRKSRASSIASSSSADKKNKQDLEQGTGENHARKSSKPEHVSRPNSVAESIPKTPKTKDLDAALFREPTFEFSSDSSDEDEGYNDINKESFLPSIGPPAILQYIKESQFPPLSREGLENEDQTDSFEMSLFSGPCMFCKKEILPFPSVEEIETLPKEKLYCCAEYEQYVKLQLAHRGSSMYEQGDELIDISPHAPYGTKAARKAAKERAAERAREREIERQKAAGGNPMNFYARTPSPASHYTWTDEFARQMKTVSYSLASVKCMEEGWTIKPTTPTPEEEEINNNPFIIEVNQRNFKPETFVQRFYEPGKKLLTLFQDGTGCCYYPSGNASVVITSQEKHKYTYIVQEDDDDYSSQNPGVLAVFEPNGYASCYFPNGDLRMVLNRFGGVLFDKKGERRRKWFWYNMGEHVHAPPFQPITFALTKYLSVRCVSQDNITLTFNIRRHTVRFNVGSKLKALTRTRPVEERSDHDMYLREVRQFVNILNDRVQNLVKFPKHPKLNKLPPPLHLRHARKSLLDTGPRKPNQEQGKSPDDPSVVIVN